MNKGYRVVRLDNDSMYGRKPVTVWLTYNEALAYLRYCNRGADRFDIESKRRVLQKVGS